MSHRRILLLAALAAVPLLSPRPAEAVPAWTRRTGMDCGSCHFGGTNRLTKIGRDFMLRGHRLSSEEGFYIAEKGSLNLLDYFSLASKFRYTVRERLAETDDPSTAFDVEALSIYTGGPINKNFSYFVEHYLHERGGGGASNTRSKLADAYLKYSTDPAAPKHAYVRAGQVYPYLIYMASSGGRLSIGRPAVINSNIGVGNQYTPRDRATGISGGWVDEETGLHAEAAIINGAGGNATPNQPERDNHKDVYITLDKDLDEYGSNIGVYGYSGQMNVTGLVDGVSTTIEDSFTRYGILGALQREKFVVSAAYMMGNHDALAGGDRDPEGFYVEGGYNFRPDITGFARYDSLDRDQAGDSKITGPTLGVSYRLPNVGRAVVEFSSLKDEALTTDDQTRNQFQFEINWLF